MIYEDEVTKSHFPRADLRRSPTRDTSRRYRLTFGEGASERSVLIRVGGRYIVEPTHPNQHRNRGRVGRIVELDDARTPRSAALLLEDSRRVTLVECSELLSFD